MKRPFSIPIYAISFGIMISLSFTASHWFWYRIFFALLFLHGTVLAHAFVKAYHSKP